MSEGIQIPISADLAALQAAMGQIQGHVMRMGDRVSASLQKTNASISRTSSAAAVIQKAFSRAWQTISRGAAAAFRGMVSAARTATRAIGSALSSVMGLARKLGGMLKFALPIGGLLSFAGAAGMAMKSIGKAAEMETLETAFAPLLGGAAAAKERIAELAAFAAATPFELPGIAQGSRVLQVLTKGALATGESLRMVGDVAAATQAPFQEIAMWVGRLYDGLQSGRPVGEAMMRLQEMGVVSGDVRSRIEALQKSGAAGPKIWEEAAAALGRFSGSMERQSVTWNGKLSTLRDTISQTMAEFGKPLIDGLKPFLDMAIAKINSMKEAAAAMGVEIQTALDAGLAAFQTGNLIGLFSAGIQLAMIEGVNKLWSGIVGSVAFLSGSLGGIMMALGKGLQESGIFLTVESVFLGIGELFRSSILSTAGEFQSAMRHIAIEFAGLISPLFGKKVAKLALGEDKDSAFNQASAKAAERAQTYFDISKAGVASIDIGRGISAMGEDFIEAMRVGRDAYIDATSNALIDPSIAKSNWDEFWKSIQAQMSENKAARAALEKEMDDKLKGTSGDDSNGSPAAAAAKSINPLGVLTNSLGRVGGGGFGMTFFPMISEQKRTNAVLNRIEKHVAMPRVNSIPAIV